jgi:hypothetical protein
MRSPFVVPSLSAALALRPIFEPAGKIVPSSGDSRLTVGALLEALTVILTELDVVVAPLLSVATA